MSKNEDKPKTHELSPLKILFFLSYVLIALQVPWTWTWTSRIFRSLKRTIGASRSHGQPLAMVPGRIVRVAVAIAISDEVAAELDSE